MLRWFTHRPNYSRTAREIYGSIVASARQETFYAAWGVPDRHEGRFEMLAAQVALAMLRLGRAGAAGTATSRALGETFITDMDDNMREIGIGDLAVPRKIKRAAAALYDRHRDYGAALSADDDRALVAAISECVGGACRDEAEAARLDCAALTRYMRGLWAALAAVSDRDCCAGRLPLPWLAEFAAPPAPRPT